MSDYLPVYTPGQAFTLTASAAITGGQLLEVTGSGTVGPAAAGSVKVVGVAAFDCASGARITVWGRRPGPRGHRRRHITAGDPVVSAANGQVAAAAPVTTDAADVTTTARQGRAHHRHQRQPRPLPGSLSLRRP
jgi:hypothetical protein